MKWHKQCGRPLFFCLRHAPDKRNKLGSFFERGWCFNAVAKHCWMTEIAYRYVRRFKTLAIHADDLRYAIHSRWGDSKTFSDGMPDSRLSIGYLIADNKLERVRATGQSLVWQPSTAVAEAAQYRYEKIEKLKKKRALPEGKVFDALVLSLELEKYLQLIGKERKFDVNRRSDAAKQAWIRRQQGSNSANNGGCYQPFGSDHGSCNQ